MNVKRVAPRPFPAPSPSPLKPTPAKPELPRARVIPKTVAFKDSFHPAASGTPRAPPSTTPPGGPSIRSHGPSSGVIPDKVNCQAPSQQNNFLDSFTRGVAREAQQSAQDTKGLLNGVTQNAKGLVKGMARDTKDLVKGMARGTKDFVTDTKDVAQRVNQGAQHLAHDMVRDPLHLIRDAQHVEQGARGLAKNTVRRAHQGLNVLNQPGTGKVTPDPADGFGETQSQAHRRGTWPVQDVAKSASSGQKVDPDDGRIIGAGPKGPTSYPANTPLDQIPPFTPRGQSAKKPRDTIIFTNGILTSGMDEAKSAQSLANQTGKNVVCVHNGTAGMAADVIQSARDKLHLSGNQSTRTLTRLLTQAAQTGHKVSVGAHSQGGLITSHALQNTKDNLRAQGLTHAQVEERMGNFHVETLGGAAASYPSGPHYKHVVHPGDPVPGVFGIGNPINSLHAKLHGQEVVRAPNPSSVLGNKEDPLANHNLSGYIPQTAMPW